MCSELEINISLGGIQLKAHAVVVIITSDRKKLTWLVHVFSWNFVWQLE